VLIFILLLVNRRDLMGDKVNSRTYNVLAWGTSVGMLLLTLFLAAQAMWGPNP
jgi:Mn2+/Fe2+ NRAMP family transporter